MIEDMEGKMRSSLQEVYFSSESSSRFSLLVLALSELLTEIRTSADALTAAETKDITTTLRSSVGYAEGNKHRALQGELVGLLRGKAQAQQA